METIAVTINKGGPNPRKRTESASGFGPGDRIRGGTKSAGTPVQRLITLKVVVVEESYFSSDKWMALVTNSIPIKISFYGR